MHAPPHSELTVMWDEVSQEHCISYFPHADSAGGIACEDAAKVPLWLSTFDNALTIARALADGSIRYGKEASVIALASFSPTLREAYTIFVSSTCKEETANKSSRILQMIVDTWTTYGSTDFGPIWSFASDGDASRRAMVYDLFMKKPIEASLSLWKYLGRLRGLNLFVGDLDITGDFDWKHELKREKLSTSDTIVLLT